MKLKKTTQECKSIKSSSPVTFWLAVALVLITFTSSSFADCVDYSEKRARQAASALAKNPPKFSDLGFPELAGLNVDADKSSGDPKCDPPEKRTTFFYKTNASLLDFYTAIFPYMKPWKTWINPAGGDSHRFYLSSGTEVEIRCSGTCRAEDYNVAGKIKEIMIDRRNGKDALITGGPGWNWTAEDLAKAKGKPAAGVADQERPISSATAGASPSGGGISSNQSASDNSKSSNSTSNNIMPKAPDTVDDALNKAKKLKDLIRF